jgi:hypothetical protein
MKAKRIDEYICLSVEQIMLDELTDIIEMSLDDHCEEDKAFWESMQKAAKVLMTAYVVPK